MADRAASSNVDTNILAFLESVSESDGTEAISDAKFAQLPASEQVVVIEENQRIVALGVIARHNHPNGSSHWAVETVLESGLRFGAFERNLLEMTLSLVPIGAQMSVWSHRRSLDHTLSEAGFTVSRTLAYLTVDLPMNENDGTDTTRPFGRGDLSNIVSINGGAFGHHREAASLTIDDVAETLSCEGFSGEGLRVAESAGEMVGFCWTRVHPNGDGEIYRIAVDPSHQGRGIGMMLLRAGFSHLARTDAVTRGTLWVDTANKAAMAIYKNIGMVEERTNREFQRQ